MQTYLRLKVENLSKIIESILIAEMFQHIDEFLHLQGMKQEHDLLNYFRTWRRA